MRGTRNVIRVTGKACQHVDTITAKSLRLCPAKPLNLARRALMLGVKIALERTVTPIVSQVPECLRLASYAAHCVGCGPQYNG